MRKTIVALAVAMAAAFSILALVSNEEMPANLSAAEQARKSLWILADAIPGKTLGDIHKARPGTDPNPKVQAFCTKISDQDVAVFMPENLPQKDAAQFRLTCRALGYL